jgi:prolyl-tRNA synthetase
MRLSHSFGRTLREDPADADTPSHRLLLRAGLIDQLAAGIYTLLPLAVRVQRKVEQIVREEMAAAGAQEILMPVLIPLELFDRSGRNELYGDELFRLRDRRDRRFALGPTHEEVVTPLAATYARSYRDLPVTLFQIQTKMRDEPRPRAGLLRVREFTMKDAYSFDEDEAGLDHSFQAQRAAYERIFARCGLDVIQVQADSGAIGGKESVEFVLPVESGEDTIVRCPNPACGYAANTERAEFHRSVPSSHGQPPAPMSPVSTPGVKTIDQLARFLDVPVDQALKAVFYTAEHAGQAELVFVAIRGDVEVNEVKLKNVTGADALRLANDREVGAAGLVAGSASPVGISGLRTIADVSVPNAPNLVAGGNQPDVHLRNVNYGRDFTADVVADIGTAKAGDACIRCGTPLELLRGLELGHVFKLGLRYSEAFDARYLDQDGQQRPMWMGCYGIGITRILAAAVEPGHDERGIVWPAPLAPYQVHLVALNVDSPPVAEAANRLYDDLQRAGVDVLFDDRPESAGVKFNDADLLGLPLRVTLGPRGVKQGEVELKRRSAQQAEVVPLAQAVARIKELTSPRPSGTPLPQERG